MQQTQKYKLNLIEPSDPFLPEGLNENTRKLEAVVSQHLEDMEARVTVLEGFKFAFGYFMGDNPNSGGEQYVHLGFKPKAAILRMRSSVITYYMEGCEAQESGFRPAEDGFYAVYPMNTSGHWYYYYVFG